MHRTDREQVEALFDGPHEVSRKTEEIHMTSTTQAAYLISQAVSAMIEAIGMAAANSQFPEDQPYGELNFVELIDKYGLGHNDAIKTLRGL